MDSDHHIPRIPMMISRAALAAVLSLTIGGCDGILDLKDLEAVSESDVWNDAQLAEAYANRIYMDNLPGWSDDDADRSDEAAFGQSDYMYGQLTENSVDYWPYEQIRRINVLLTEIEKGTLDASLAERLRGEGHFFRAFRYWEMVRRYGGIPLILEPQDLEDDLLVERSPTSQVVDQILSDLDQAIALLPEIGAGSEENDGHVHVGTAMALKGRVLLYYASPQFNRSDDQSRWQDAYEANLAAKQYLESQGFGLYEDFEGLWFEAMNPEAIFVRRYSYPVDSHNWAAGTRPLDESQGSTDDNRPTLEMVEAFPMADGRPIESHPEFDPVYFWQNRDPRFRATIAYNGAVWELSGQTGRRQWTYVGGEANNPTQTGFYARKAVEPAADAFEAANGETQWIEIRFAEVMMNLAEAANAIGQTQLAYEQIIALRARAGIEPGDGLYGLEPGMNREEMQDAIMVERQIEFAYEAKRHWDLRRNMLFEELLNGTRRHGLRANLIVPSEEWEAVQGSVDLESEYHQYFEHEIVLLDPQFDINWQENYYFYAIPSSHLQQNSRLEQTSGWAGGSFDPLQ
jgi:hypothetical protein